LPIPPFFLDLGIRIVFFSSLLLMKENREAKYFLRRSRDKPGAVTFALVAGRIQVGGDFAFET
jgi:hypothetical protein